MYVEAIHKNIAGRLYLKHMSAAAAASSWRSQHTRDEELQTSEPIRFIDENIQTMEYIDRRGDSSRNEHRGQVKLMLGEIDFLTELAEEGDSIVYVGAADGFHIQWLDHMFKSLGLKWYLFDSSPFHSRLREWAQQNKDRVFVHTRYFNNQDAAMFAGLKPANTLLISDIRSHPTLESKPSDDQASLRLHRPPLLLHRKPCDRVLQAGIVVLLHLKWTDDIMSFAGRQSCFYYI